MYLEALSMEHQIDFVHGLDIWLPDKKVLNVEWGSLSGTKILSFRRGAWETTLLAEATPISPSQWELERSSVGIVAPGSVPRSVIQPIFLHR